MPCSVPFSSMNPNAKPPSPLLCCLLGCRVILQNANPPVGPIEVYPLGIQHSGRRARLSESPHQKRKKFRRIRRRPLRATR
jgi:hypothetical protein